MTERELDVAVLPGVPSMDQIVVDDGRVPYPDTTPDFVKILRIRGLSATFSDARQDRRYVTHKAFEVWLPILQFGLEVVLALDAGILADLLKDYLHGVPEESDTEARVNEPRVLHVDWRVSRSDGSTEEFKADGSPDAVLKAIDDFEKHLRDG